VFSVTLQLGRCVPDLEALVRINFDPYEGRDATTRIANAIVRGSRSRGHEQLATIVDQQRRHLPLTQPRPPTRRGTPLSKTGQPKKKVAA
jgi:hypothetical protein